MGNLATVLHLSDLHFVQNLYASGSHTVPLPKPLHRWRVADLAGGPKSHAFGKVEALAAKIRELRFDLDIDLLVATGDLSTNGTQGALTTARDYLERHEFLDSRGARVDTYGLDFAAHQRIILPGNHDRYGGRFRPFQQAGERLEEVFGTPKHYPYSVGFRPAVVRDDPTVPIVVFFVFDSTPSALTIKEWGRNPLGLVARGRIRPTEISWLRTESREIQRKGLVQGTDGKPLPVGSGGFIRVALVHHHPVSTRTDGSFDPNTIMVGHREFVQTCLETEVDVVLFGHDHVNRHLVGKRPSGRLTHFLCCPTATEFSGPETGFFLLTFGVEGFTKEVFTWKDPYFVEDGVSKHTYNGS